MSDSAPLLESAAAREGCSYERLTVSAVSIECADCRVRNIRLNGQMTIACQGCGHVYDVDDNALSQIDLASI